MTNGDITSAETGRRLQRIEDGVDRIHEALTGKASQEFVAAVERRLDVVGQRVLEMEKVLVFQNQLHKDISDLKVSVVRLDALAEKITIPAEGIHAVQDDRLDALEIAQAAINAVSKYRKWIISSGVLGVGVMVFNFVLNIMQLSAGKVVP